MQINAMFFNKAKAVMQMVTLMLCACMLLACGFQLRGQYLLPEQLHTIKVTSIDKHGELTRLLKQHLTINHVNLVDGAVRDKQAVPELNILKDKLDRRTLSVFPNGQVAEYELIYTVRYQLLIADKPPQNFEFELNRDYQEDPDFALAKSRELNLLLSEMRKEAADRILRALASVQL